VRVGNITPAGLLRTGACRASPISRSEAMVVGRGAECEKKRQLRLTVVVVRSTLRYRSRWTSVNASLHHLPTRGSEMPVSAFRFGRAGMNTTSRPLRVLVVDDCADAVSTCGDLLRLRGHDVRAAQSGDGALALLDGWEPDIALLDIRMPGMDGYELARRICERAPGRPVLVAVTGVGDAEARQRARDAGFDHFLVKPADPDVLTDLLWAYAVTLNIGSGE
jgi:CheY-like chemotaxis protein